jgi:V/A-type H+-transporting ATPase subunit E
MDTQLKELIETIKTEGVENAERQSAEIIEKAETRAKEIVSEAEQRADRIVQDAQKEASRREESGKEMLLQSSRDLLLSTEAELKRIFERVIQDSVGESYSQKTVEEAIVKVIEGWSQKGATDLTILLSEADQEQLEKNLRSRLSETVRQGVDIKPSPSVRSGFRVAEKGGSVYYDFTSTGIAEAMAAFLNPRLAEIVREAVKGSENQ